MARRSTTRTVLKWTGTMLCLLLATLWAVSHSGYILTYVDRPHGTVFFRKGRICQPFNGITPRDYLGPEGWHVFRRGTLPFALDDIQLPLWLPMLLVGGPTGFLWYGDLTRWIRVRCSTPPGHCQHCGYNLTGNVSGRCPECGEKI